MGGESANLTSMAHKPPRKHHYIPRFYLAGFASLRPKPRLWVYEKGRDPRKSTPKLEGCQRDFYTVEQNGEKNFEFEEWLGNLEARVAPLIPDLVKNKREPNENERICLSVFMGTMFTRTPFGMLLGDKVFGPGTSKMLKRAASDPDEFYKLYESIETGFPGKEAAEHVRQDVLAGKGEKLEEQRDFQLASMLHVGIDVAEVVCDMGWQFIHAPHNQTFITSDNPLVSEVSEGWSREVHFRSGVNLPNARVWFPLTSQVCLLMRKGLTPGIATAPAATIRSVNKRVMICADKVVYAGEFSKGIQGAFERHGCQVPLEKLDMRYEGEKL